MLFKIGHHEPQDYQSFRMHQEAVRMLCNDPSLADRLLKYAKPVPRPAPSGTA